MTTIQFDTTARASFRAVVAARTGSICGINGITACAASDVTIASWSRRSVTVSFSLTTYIESAASSAVSTLDTAIAAASFTTALQAEGGNLASVSGATVTSSGYAQVTATSTDDELATEEDPKKDEPSMLMVVVVALLICICCPVVLYAMYYIAGSDPAENERHVELDEASNSTHGIGVGMKTYDSPYAQSV